MTSSRSNKKLSRAENGQTIDHSKYMHTYRQHVMRILREIRAGNIDEMDLDKLQNFCQMSLSLMALAPMTQIQSAWRHAEILAFEHGQVEDVEGRQDTEIVAGETVPKQEQRKSTTVNPFLSGLLNRSK